MSSRKASQSKAVSPTNRGSRAVIAQLDARLSELDRELRGMSELMAERRRLLAARTAITGQRLSVSGSYVRRVTQDEIAAYLAEHPGVRASVIARELGVPLTNISQHLHRGATLVLKGARMAGTTVELLHRRDLDTLAWAAEQYVARSDQLSILLGCGPRTVQRLIARLRQARLADQRRLLAGEPAWIIPTVKGLRACGSSFGAWRPRLGLLSHVAAVNDVRLHIQGRAPGSQWVCERVIAREREHPREHLPDALVLTGERRVAIEVELTVKSRRRLATILDELTGRYDAVLYFCTPASRRVLSELSESGRWPALGVRELPEPLKDRR